MHISDLCAAMEEIAPLAFAESWDKVGLQVGSCGSELAGPIVLTIDLRESVLHEAIKLGADAIVAYHPPIFSPIDSITDHTVKGRILFEAARAGIAIYTPHTALDAAPGGITDWLCEGLSTTHTSHTTGVISGDCRALCPHLENLADPKTKIVTFVPRDAVEKMRNALASAGAGLIGEYSVCSFAIDGIGTFLGSEKSNPVVGKAGQLEEVKESRLEMVCPKRALALAVATLRRFHPYEEPPFDIYDLEPVPRRRVGAGRRLVLDQPATMHELAQRLKAFLGDARIQLGFAGPPQKPVQTLGIVPGSGESLLPMAAAQGCEAFITGEMKHHQVLGCLNDGMHVLLAGHTNTERGYLPRLADKLSEMLEGIKIQIAQTDRDPLTVIEE